MAVDPEAVEELHALLLGLYPEPVDVFEDRLVVGLSIQRHPVLSYDEWRRVRAAAIEAVDGEGAADPEPSPACER